MTLLRRAKRWYADCTVDGQRCKQSLQTGDWCDANGSRA
jgi:hypothetical protein